MQEVFKTIPEHPNYQVSNLGRVKSLFGKKELLMKLSIGTNGYLQVTISNYKKESGSCRVHQLVTMAFLGHKPNGFKGLIVDHINNIKTDNRLENLQLVTNRYNSSKDKKGGTSKYPGVSWQVYKWIARIRVEGKKVHLGYFTNEYDAHLAVQNKLKQIKNKYNLKLKR